MIRSVMTTVLAPCSTTNRRILPPTAGSVRTSPSSANKRSSAARLGTLRVHNRHHGFARTLVIGTVERDGRNRVATEAPASLLFQRGIGMAFEPHSKTSLSPPASNVHISSDHAGRLPPRGPARALVIPVSVFAGAAGGTELKSARSDRSPLRRLLARKSLAEAIPRMTCRGAESERETPLAESCSRW